MRKRIFLAIVILTFVSAQAFAQRDGFFNDWKDIDNREIIGGGDMPNLPLSHGYGDDQDADAPLGTGLLILTALGTGYAVVKRKKKSR